MKNIQAVSDSYLCSNCGACSAICPKDAIIFKWSNIGRLYANVNDQCIDCGLCQKVCPSIDTHNIHDVFPDRFVGDIRKVYVGRTNNIKYFQNAQSGGVATGILEYLFDKQLINAAVVCRMDYDNTPKVNPIIIERKEELYQTQKSCYTPVALLSVLKEVKKYNSVAVVGLPCHIQGIEEIQRSVKSFNNIKYRIGLICDRTECAGIQEVIKKYTGYDSFKINWRQKYDSEKELFNYKSAPIVALSSSGESIELPRHYRIALKEMFTPPRCRVCWDKINVFADITLGDPWRLKGFDSEKGESLIVVRTGCGVELIDKMIASDYLVMREYDIEALFRSQLIDDRRRHVEQFSSSFKVLSPQINSYLIKDNADCGNTVNECVLQNFIHLENSTKDDMFSEAESQIKLYEKIQRQKHTFSGKIKSFINRLINKIK